MTIKKTDSDSSSKAKPGATRPRAAARKDPAKTPAAKPARKTAAPRTRKKTAPSAPPGEPGMAQRRTPTHDEIAARAREIWREKGGTAFENWVQAERELQES